MNIKFLWLSYHEYSMSLNKFPFSIQNIQFYINYMKNGIGKKI
jgi:hypothetical protein